MSDQKFKQVIICCETNKKTGSDFIYVKEIISEFFPEVLKTHSLQYVPMGGKHGYKNVSVSDEILYHKKNEESSKVVFVFDKDESNNSAEDVKFIKDVINYAKLNNISIVWFVKNIEQVMLGKNSKMKTVTAGNYKKNKMIKKLDKELLSNRNPKTKVSSNILIVFNEIFL